MESRALLVMDLQQAGLEIRGLVSGQHWKPLLCPSLSEAQHQLAAQECRVGIVLFSDSVDAASINKLESFIRQNNTTVWLAMVEPSLLKRKDMCELIALYFFAYHVRPVDALNLLITLEHAYQMAVLHSSISIGDGASLRNDGFPFVGESPEINLIKQQILKVADTDATVLITGESGTGKELIAKSIHQYSSRASQPFVALNCGAFQENLIQAELFGHEKGAFTGAHQRKQGRAELANKGTLFLDEVGDLPPAQQINFLRFLQEGTFERVGGTETLKIDARVVAATHVNLNKAVREGRVREDFYYRLNVLNIEVPPLRERRGDIELLAQYYFRKVSREYNSQVAGFSQQALNRIRNHTWPGNIRELINRVRRAVMLCETRLITSEDLGFDRHRTYSARQTLAEARAHAEKELIAECLARCGNNISEAARLLKVSRLTLYRLIEKHGVYAYSGKNDQNLKLITNT